MRIPRETVVVAKSFLAIASCFALGSKGSTLRNWPEEGKNGGAYEGKKQIFS
jgi:hypothetical protein